MMLPIHSHQGRHTFATQMVGDGIRHQTIASRLAMKLTRHQSSSRFDYDGKRTAELLAEVAFLATADLQQRAGDCWRLPPQSR